VANNDSYASIAQIKAPARGATIVEALDILANSTSRSRAPRTQAQAMEEATTRFLMHARMANHAMREMEALYVTDGWQPAPEDILTTS
jgi:hypothetical protein